MKESKATDTFVIRCGVKLMSLPHEVFAVIVFLFCSSEMLSKHSLKAGKPMYPFGIPPSQDCFRRVWEEIAKQA